MEATIADIDCRDGELSVAWHQWESNMDVDYPFGEGNVYWEQPEPLLSTHSLPSDIMFHVFSLVPSAERRTVIPLVCEPQSCKQVAAVWKTIPR
jgi:hypothetical protein